MSKSLKGEILKDANFVGAIDLTDIKTRELSVLGSLTFNNLTVEQDADVAGPITNSENGNFSSLTVLGTFEASDITCKNLDIAGSVIAAGLTVNGDASIVGSLIVKTSKNPSQFPNRFHKLNVSAEIITLEDTDVEGDIFVHPSLKSKALKWLGKDSKQVLHLREKSRVKGNITFGSGEGKIVLGPEAKIEGKVTGAIIEQE